MPSTPSSTAIPSGESALETPLDLDQARPPSHNALATSLPTQQGAKTDHIDQLSDRVWVRYHNRQTIQQKLRISLVDNCNLSCFFCHNEGQGAIRRASNTALDAATLERIVRIAVSEGVTKIKLTGGEPLLYRSSSGDVVSLVRTFADLRRGTQPFDLSITTNGTLLPGMASRLASAGLDRVTVSLTTTSMDTFQEFISTRTHLLKRTFAGIDEALRAGLRPIKLNVPIYYSPSRHAGNLRELTHLIEFALNHGVNEVRFFTLISHDNFPEFNEYYHFFSPAMSTALTRCLSHFGLGLPGETVELLAKLGSTFAGRAYPKVEFGINIGPVRVGFEAMKHGRLGSAPGQQEGPYAMRLAADGSLRSMLSSTPSYVLINAVRAGASEETLRALYRTAQGEML